VLGLLGAVPGEFGVVEFGVVPGLVVPGAVPGFVAPGLLGVVGLVGVVPAGGGGAVLPGGVPAGGVAVLPGGVAVLLGGVAVPAGGVAGLPGGVAVPPGGVAAPGVELWPEDPDPPAGAVPPDGELCATTQVVQPNISVNKVIFDIDIRLPRLSGLNGLTLLEQDGPTPESMSTVSL
jgi:hypothetical protein